jgi:GDP-L-fucose synthase
MRSACREIMMDKDDKIYVAGHRGLVGSAIMRVLEKNGFQNLICRTHHDLDLTDQSGVTGFFKKERPDYVFLAAAKVGGIYANDTFPAEFIKSNLMVQSNVIDASWEHGTKKLLFLGSSCIYPKLAPQPMKEEYLLTAPLEPTNQWYAIAKIAGIKMCQAYRRQYGFNAISIMPTNLYGPGDNFDLEDSHVLAALLRKFHLARLAEQGKWDEIDNNESLMGIIPDDIKASLVAVSKHNSHEPIRPNPYPLPPNPTAEPAVRIWGTGKPRREFLHVDDLAEAALFLMENYDDPEIINVGAGKDISIGELAELIKEITGCKSEIAFDSSKPDGTPRKLLDISKIEKLGWKPKISLREGIESTYKWFIEQSRIS